MHITTDKLQTLQHSGLTFGKEDCLMIIENSKFQFIYKNTWKKFLVVLQCDSMGMFINLQDKLDLWSLELQHFFSLNHFKMCQCHLSSPLWQRLDEISHVSIVLSCSTMPTLLFSHMVQRKGVQATYKPFP